MLGIAALECLLVPHRQAGAARWTIAHQALSRLHALRTVGATTSPQRTGHQQYSALTVGRRWWIATLGWCAHRVVVPAAAYAGLAGALSTAVRWGALDLASPPTIPDDHSTRIVSAFLLAAAWLATTMTRRHRASSTGMPGWRLGVRCLLAAWWTPSATLPLAVALGSATLWRVLRGR